MISDFNGEGGDVRQEDTLGKQIAIEISRYANSRESDRGNNALVDTILRDHRTIQQGIGRIVIQLIEAWSNAYEDRRYDARNEAICKFANTCMKNTDVRDRALPFI